MKKRTIYAVLLAVLVCLPCLLVLDGGPDAPIGEERLGWTNAVGLLWFAFLALGGFKLITPKWMRDELNAYMGDN